MPRPDRTLEVIATIDPYGPLLAAYEHGPGPTRRPLALSDPATNPADLLREYCADRALAAGHAYRLPHWARP